MGGLGRSDRPGPVHRRARHQGPRRRRRRPVHAHGRRGGAHHARPPGREQPPRRHHLADRRPQYAAQLQDPHRPDCRLHVYPRGSRGAADRAAVRPHRPRGTVGDVPQRRRQPPVAGAARPRSQRGLHAVDLPHDHRVQGPLRPRHRDLLSAGQRRRRVRLNASSALERPPPGSSVGAPRRTSSRACTRSTAGSTRSCAACSGSSARPHSDSEDTARPRRPPDRAPAALGPVRGTSPGRRRGGGRSRSRPRSSPGS